MTEAAAPANPIKIKKYANRRLYNTATSSYVTLEYLCQLVKDNVDFVVVDAKTEEDITRAVLTQIIVEQEGKGQQLLPLNFLRQLIGFYGDNLQMLVPKYLDQSMESFVQQQQNFRQQLQQTFGPMFPLPQLDDVTRRNMDFFQKSLQMFNPFGAKNTMGTEKNQERSSPSSGGQPDQSLKNLKEQLDQLQQQLNQLQQNSKK